MKAPDIYTELVITNFLENKKKTKKRQGKLLALVNTSKAATPRNTYGAAAMYNPRHLVCCHRASKVSLT